MAARVGPRAVSLRTPVPAGVAAGTPHGSWGGGCRGEGGPRQGGTGRETRQPSQQALLGWRAQLWIRFSRNTKPPAWSLSPRHWGLCQACAHPLCPCQGGGWAGRTDPGAPAGLSGGGWGGVGTLTLLKPSPAVLLGTELLRLGGELAPWRVHWQGGEPLAAGALSTSAWRSAHVSFLD